MQSDIMATSSLLQYPIQRSRNERNMLCMNNLVWADECLSVLLSAQEYFAYILQQQSIYKFQS